MGVGNGFPNVFQFNDKTKVSTDEYDDLDIRPIKVK